MILLTERHKNALKKQPPGQSSMQLSCQCMVQPDNLNLSLFKRWTGSNGPDCAKYPLLYPCDEGRFCHRKMSRFLVSTAELRPLFRGCGAMSSVWSCTWNSHFPVHPSYNPGRSNTIVTSPVSHAAWRREKLWVNNDKTTAKTPAAYVKTIKHPNKHPKYVILHVMVSRLWCLCLNYASIQNESSGRTIISYKSTSVCIKPYEWRILLMT